LKLIRCPRFDSCAPAHFDLSVCPSMLLASPRLHSRAYPRHFTFYVADPVSSIARCRPHRTRRIISASLVPDGQTRGNGNFMKKNSVDRKSDRRKAITISRKRYAESTRVVIRKGRTS
jgi:hypothetical protein